MQVADAMMTTATKFLHGTDGLDIRDSGKIRDANGNTVGKWEIRADPCEGVKADDREEEACILFEDNPNRPGHCANCDRFQADHK